MKKFAKGTFKFTKLKNPTASPKTISDSIIAWADRYHQLVETYLVENDTALHVDYDIVADSAGLRNELVKSLKASAREWGSIELVTEMRGEQAR